MAEVDPSISLAQFLRDNLYLTGTKIGCGKGECGACTIIMDGKSVTSCIIPVMRAEGTVIQTIEGVAQNGKLHPLQEEFVNQGAVQCGFCTPGIIMSAVEIVGSGRQYTRDELRRLISGHLCRCTGYQNILNAVERAVNECSKLVGREDA